MRVLMRCMVASRSPFHLLFAPPQLYEDGWGQSKDHVGLNSIVEHSGARRQRIGDQAKLALSESTGGRGIRL